MALLTTIFIIGLSGLIAQIIILRELLVNFSGNELTVGIILANWVALEAAGVFFLGKAIERIKNKLNVFIALNILFALILPFTVYFARTFKAFIGLPFIEAVSLPIIFFSSLVIIFPTAFLHGALFSCACKEHSLITNNSERSIRMVYAWEALGTIAGGIILVFLLIPRLTSFQIVLIISFLNIILSIFLTRAKKRYFYLCVITFLCVLFSAKTAGYLQRVSIDKQWQGQFILDYRNSNYANIAVTKKLNQYTFFYNGVPAITTPFPDKQFVSDFANLPLLFHDSPQDILIVGSGIGGLIAESLKHPLKSLDYVEIDPLIVKLLKEYSTSLSDKELADNRVDIINTDPRLFLRTSKKSYDVILIGLSAQADLSSNRFFTEEFFKRAKMRLNPKGIIALWMPGSLTYLSSDLKDLNNCVWNSLKSSFKYTRVIPGDYNIFIASEAGGIMLVNPALLSERLIKRGIVPGILIPDYLQERLSQRWLDWFNQELSLATKESNQDLRPAAVYATLKIINKKFSPGFSRVFSYLGYVNLKLLFLIIFLMSLGVMVVSKIKRDPKIPVAYAIFTTGFFGMLASLLLLFAYQVSYGCLYQMISILTAVFILGAAIGVILLSPAFSRLKKPRLILIIMEALIISFIFILGLVITRGSLVLNSSTTIFYCLLFIAGLLMGLEFPLAAKIYLKDNKDNAGGVSGLLYASDLIGGWLAGIFGGVIFLPVLGFFNTCLLMVMLKLGSLLVLINRDSDRL